MSTISGEKLAKIRRLRKELSQTKLYYFNKINPLRQKELQLRHRPVSVGLLTSKIADKKDQAWQEVKDELTKLEQERNDKVKKLEAELALLKKDYRDNYDKYKEEDRKARNDKWLNTKADIKIFLDRYKYALIFGSIIIGAIIIVKTVTSAVNGARIATEESRNYYIYVDEKYTYDCNARYDGGFSAYCEDRFVDGSFSNYETVHFSWATDMDINGNNFTKKIYDYVEPSVYRKEDFDIESLKGGMDKKHYFGLWNEVLNREVASKTVNIHYNFSDSDLSLISQLHEKWVKEEAEKKAKAQQEAEEKEAKERQEAEEKEARERQEAEEMARKEEEEKAAREKAEREEAERKAAEEEAKRSYRIKSINDGEGCPSNAQYCYINGNSTGYPEYGYGLFRGKIINNTGKNLSYIQVVADVYNSAGSKIGDCWGNTSGLAAGVTWEFEAYCTAWDYGVSLKNIDIAAY